VVVQVGNDAVQEPQPHGDAVAGDGVDRGAVLLAVHRCTPSSFICICNYRRSRVLPPENPGAEQYGCGAPPRTAPGVGEEFAVSPRVRGCQVRSFGQRVALPTACVRITITQLTAKAHAHLTRKQLLTYSSRMVATPNRESDVFGAISHPARRGMLDLL